MQSKAPSPYVYFLSISLCLMPFLGILAPRALSFVPALIGLLGFGLHRLVYGAWPCLPKVWFWGALTIPALALLSALWAVAPPEALSRALNLGGIFLGGLLFLGVYWRAPEALKTAFAKAWPWALLLAGIFLALEVRLQGPVYQLLHPDLEGGFRAPFLNRSSVFFALCFWSGFYTAGFHAPMWGRILRAALLLTAAIVLWQNDSQSAQLAFVVGGIFYALFPVGCSWTWRALALFLVAGLSFAPVMAQILFDMAAQKSTDFEWLRHSFAANRMEIWDFIARRALERPLFGHGIEATRMITDFDTARLYHPDSHILHPHNFAMQIWIEFGAFGAAFFAALMALFLTALKRSENVARAMCIGVFAGTLCVASTAYGMWQSWWIGALFVLTAQGLLAMQFQKR